jgi:deoxyribodipyrimidine photo-lyase
MRYLYWFQNDLRLDDNPTLSSTLDADSLLCIYLLPKPRPWCNLVGLGPQRDRFMRESLQELREQLQSLGQDLMVLEGSPELVLPAVIARFEIDHLVTESTPGWHESQALSHLRNKLDIPVTTLPGNRLFQPKQFPFSLEDYPDTFSPFRRKVEALAITPTLPAPKTLPPPPCRTV